MLFRHNDFEEEYGEVSLGHAAETWSLRLSRLVSFLGSGALQPYVWRSTPSTCRSVCGESRRRVTAAVVLSVTALELWAPRRTAIPGRP